MTLAVKDTGCGIDPEALDHVFDPFFTTKGPGSGVGLGLSVVHGIAKQSGGTIHVSSKPGAGTTIQMRLPAALEVDVAVPADEPNQRIAAVGGGETVLLVEDEEVVRATVREGLQQLGYTVLEADRPSSAIALSRGHTGRIHVVVSDVVMPEMSGNRLAARILAERHDTRVIYLSGYAPDSFEDELVPQGDSLVFLQKPVLVRELARKIREVLDER